MKIPHGTIFLEPRLEEFVTDSYKLFFQHFAEAYGWNLFFDSKVTADKFYGDILIINNMPVANFPFCGTYLKDVQKFHGKVIVFLRDVHTRDNKLYVDEMRRLLDRADLILAFSNEHFLKMWGDYRDKFVWFPQYFAPTGRFFILDDLPLAYRKHICLVPGMSGPAVYPLRHLALVNPILCCDNIPKHPRYDKLNLTDDFCIREQYAQLLRSYCCVLTDGSVYNYLLQKHMEIPACGSVLVTNRFADLDKAGFVAGEHYVEVDEDNYQDKILEIMKNPHSFQETALAAQTFVLENYSFEQAMIRFVKIIMEKVNATL